MRLAGAMTLKMAGIDVPFGGGKAVLATPGPLSDGDRRELLLSYGELVDSLGGTYRTGPDVNTTVADMDVIGERTPYVFCRSVERGGSGDPGPHTARGVFHGIRASMRHAFGSDELAGRSILVQGVGHVGERLAEQLANAGARVLVERHRRGPSRRSRRTHRRGDRRPRRCAQDGVRRLRALRARRERSTRTASRSCGAVSSRAARTTSSRAEDAERLRRRRHPVRARLRDQRGRRPVRVGDGRARLDTATRSRPGTRVSATRSPRSTRAQKTRARRPRKRLSGSPAPESPRPSARMTGWQ